MEKFTVHLTVKLQILLEYFSKGLKEKLGKQVYNIQHQYSKQRIKRESATSKTKVAPLRELPV